MDWKNEHPKYNFSTLNDEEIEHVQCPWQLWDIWQKEARTIQTYTNEIALATSDKEGHPSVRMVLLKHSSPEQGFCWFTNRGSEKGQQITQNPRAEILWFIKEHQRQIRIRGEITELSREEVISYSHSRPKKSQISALISHQSSPIQSKKELIDTYDAALSQYENEEVIPVNPLWTGFRLQPQRFEFWQGSSNRLHDRIIFERITDTPSQETTWRIYRLQP